MSPYTPTTEEIRAAALTDYREEEIAPQQFDRWLAEELAEAWEKGWKSGYSENEWGTKDPNPYREGADK